MGAERVNRWYRWCRNPEPKRHSAPSALEKPRGEAMSDSQLVEMRKKED